MSTSRMDASPASENMLPSITKGSSKALNLTFSGPRKVLAILTLGAASSLAHANPTPLTIEKVNALGGTVTGYFDAFGEGSVLTGGPVTMSLFSLTGEEFQVTGSLNPVETFASSSGDLLIDVEGVKFGVELNPNYTLGSNGVYGFYTQDNAAIGFYPQSDTSFYFYNGDPITFSPITTSVPEPGTLALMGAGLGVAALSRRRRESK